MKEFDFTPLGKIVDKSEATQTIDSSLPAFSGNSFMGNSRLTEMYGYTPVTPRFHSDSFSPNSFMNSGASIIDNVYPNDALFSPVKKKFGW